MKKTILIFGGLAVTILLLFELSKLSLLAPEGSAELLIIFSGCLFIVVGYLFHRFLRKSDTIKSTAPIDKHQLGKTNLSKQEYKVLTLMADGLSNVQIAEALFIAESTVKTHVSKILSKLNASRRTEAVKIGRDMNIL